MQDKKPHILVVDDDTRLRSLLQRFLRENNFLVSVAKDAFSAREMLKEYVFDLLIVEKNTQHNGSVANANTKTTVLWRITNS